MGGGQSVPNNQRRIDEDIIIPRNDVMPRQPTQQRVIRANPGPMNVPAPGGKVVVMNNDLILIQNSVKLVKSTKNPNLHSIIFTIDSLFESIVSAFFFSHDNRDPLLEITYELVADEKYNVPPKHLKYPAGRFIKISENSYNIDLEKYTDEDLSHHTADFYPLILRLEKIDPSKREKKVFFYYYHFVKEEGVLTIKQIRQKMELNGQAFEVNEIYGINSTEFGKSESATIGDSEKECIICFADNRDTIILPCRHMCLCVSCAKSLQSQSNSKCPICRKDIESFLRLTKNMQQQFQPQMQMQQGQQPQEQIQMQNQSSPPSSQQNRHNARASSRVQQ